MNSRKRKKKICRDKNELYLRLGYIVHLSQMIEFNLLDILAANKYFEGVDKLGNDFYLFEYNEVVEASNKTYSKMNRLALGPLLDKAKEDKIFTEEFVKLLENVRDRRNMYIHQVFKNDLRNNKVDSNPSFYFKGINETIHMMISVNDVLVNISKECKNQGKEIKSYIF